MKRKNLNVGLASARKKRFKTRGLEIWTDDIVERIVEKLALCDGARLCVAWLTHPALLSALDDINDVKAVVTRSKFMKQRPYIRYMGNARKDCPMMHHKFCVGLKGGKPLWVMTGSFNWTASATRSLENVVCITNAKAVQFYLREHGHIWDKARS
jgi:hypothetical protein